MALGDSVGFKTVQEAAQALAPAEASLARFADAAERIAVAFETIAGLAKGFAVTTTVAPKE